LYLRNSVYFIEVYRIGCNNIIIKVMQLHYIGCKFI